MLSLCWGHSSIAAQGLRCPKRRGVAKKWKIMISQQRFIKSQLYIQYWMRFPNKVLRLNEPFTYSTSIYPSNHPCVLSVTPYPLTSVNYELVCPFSMAHISVGWNSGHGLTGFSAQAHKAKLNMLAELSPFVEPLGKKIYLQIHSCCWQNSVSLQD